MALGAPPVLPLVVADAGALPLGVGLGLGLEVTMPVASSCKLDSTAELVSLFS